MKTEVIERAHLLGLLRIQLTLMKKEKLSTNDVYRSLENWIKNREQAAGIKENKNG
ncbi:hypothetical protein [Hafnia alvei]|uniref:hypothetical protein n=1 Tax=Hafnia alvei TaxID=569 RepID=UPI00187D5F3B|nr:hypothetical protein [Hafnia alvei]